MAKEELEKEVLEYLNTQTLPKVDTLVYRLIKNLILGFAEKKEKRIKELEKENAELNEQVARMINGACNIYQSDNGRLRNYNNRLYNENAKFKEANETLYAINNNMWVELEEKRAESLRIIMLEEEKKGKRIEELEQQIEKTKCCGNCNNTWNGMKLDICADCKNFDKWELKK